MLNRLPKLIMPLSMLLDDIGSPKASALAKAFRVSEKDAANWIKSDDAPLPVMLALFWLTRWGHSAVHCEAHNAAILQAAIAASLRREVENLTDKLAHLGRIADFGAANDPAPGVELPCAPSPLAITSRAKPAAPTGTTEHAPASTTNKNQRNHEANQAVDRDNYRLAPPRRNARGERPTSQRATNRAEGGAT